MLDGKALNDRLCEDDDAVIPVTEFEHEVDRYRYLLNAAGQSAMDLLYALADARGTLSDEQLRVIDRFAKVMAAIQNARAVDLGSLQIEN